jgi:rhodanese-related sulfurtransferase
MSIELITVEELSSKLKTTPNTKLIDVRTPAEFDSSHIDKAINLPLGSKELSNFIQEHRGTNETVYVTCQKGGRAQTACMELAKENIPIKSLSGGMNSWVAAKLPVKEGRKIMSLERQVRIAAGSFVLLGVVLYYLGFQSAILLSGFVGAGLIFAGVTDTCGMGLIIAKMPWNQSCSNKNSCCS